MKIEKTPRIILDEEDLLAFDRVKKLLEQLCTNKVVIEQETTSLLDCRYGMYKGEDFIDTIDVIDVILQVSENKEKAEQIIDEFTKKKLETLNKLIDSRCDMFGIAGTLDYLIKQGYTEKELISMFFDSGDVKEAFERAKED